MLFETLDALELRKVVAVTDPASGLRALIAIHDTTLGPAVGGVRTRPFTDEWAALDEAARLARTMTYKCALAGLPCGGGKAVVLETPELDRAHAFEVLGAAVESLGGLFRTAGDMGTDESDLRAMERRTRYVHLEAQGLDLRGATARGVYLALREAAVPGADDLEGATVVVQGAGTIGAAVASVLADAHARVLIADLDPERAAGVAEPLGATVLDAELVYTTPCDVLVPCAGSFGLDAARAAALPARVVCGAANNPLADDAVAELLHGRGVLYVPDFVANAGAAIEGLGASLLELDDRSDLIERIAATTRRVLAAAREQALSPLAVARTLARERIAEAMPKWRRSG